MPKHTLEASSDIEESADSLQNREIEAKFLLVDNALADQWRTGAALAGGYRLANHTQVADTDTYYDSADFALLRRGYTLRLRDRRHTGNSETPAEQIVGCKDIDFNTPRGVHARSEVEVAMAHPLPTGAEIAREDLPDEIGALVGKALNSRRYGNMLLPIAQVQQVRHKSHVMAPHVHAEPLGELSVDDLIIMRPIKQSEGERALWRKVERLTMAEIEIHANSSREALRSLAGELRTNPGLTPTDLGKAQTALLAIAKSVMALPLEELTRLHTAEFCRAIWAAQLAEMLVNEAGVRASGDIEYVHDMRVATRRARAAARLYAGYFFRGKRRIDYFARLLRKTGRRLGKVRDLDVAIARMQRFAEERAEGADSNSTSAKDQRRNDKALAHRIEELERSRKSAHAELVKWLDSKQYSRFIARFARFCATPGKSVVSSVATPGEAPLPVQLRHTLPSMIWSRFEAVRAFEPIFEGSAGGTAGAAIPVETLHALRIECKYLRYHLEFAAPLLGADGESLIAALRTLQEELGTLNDAVVGGQLLLDRADAAQDAPLADGDPGDALEQWQALQASNIEQMRKSIPAGFAAFVGHDTRVCLARAIASL